MFHSWCHSLSIKFQITIVAGFQHVIHYILSECFTKGGPETGKLCVFPFTYKGTTYQKCTGIEHDRLWCSTEVDDSRVHVKNKWGNCGDRCNQSKVPDGMHLVFQAYYIDLLGIQNLPLLFDLIPCMGSFTNYVYRFN